jgi:hypothetical protein
VKPGRIRTPQSAPQQPGGTHRLINQCAAAGPCCEMASTYTVTRTLCVTQQSGTPVRQSPISFACTHAAHFQRIHNCSSVMWYVKLRTFRRRSPSSWRSASAAQASHRHSCAPMRPVHQDTWARSRQVAALVPHLLSSPDSNTSTPVVFAAVQYR